MTLTTAHLDTLTKHAASLRDGAARYQGFFNFHFTSRDATNLATAIESVLDQLPPPELIDNIMAEALATEEQRWTTKLVIAAVDRAHVAGFMRAQQEAPAAQPATTLQRFRTAHATGHTGALYEDPAGPWVRFGDVRPPTVPPEILHHAKAFASNDYRGPLSWARAVFDWVVSLPAAPESTALDEHQRHWLKIRTRVIDALAARGLQIITTAQDVRLMPLATGAAQASAQPAAPQPAAREQQLQAELDRVKAALAVAAAEALEAKPAAGPVAPLGPTITCPWCENSFVPFTPPAPPSATPGSPE